MATIQIRIQEPYRSLVLRGQKTIEGRLSKGKFKDLQVGDFLLIEPGQESFVVTKLTRYSSFKDMLGAEGVSVVVPDKKTIDEAVAVYRSFYTPAMEQEYGVIAIALARAE